MELEKIREQISEEISTNIELWSDVFDNTIPGNYGLNDWDVVVNEDSLFVNIPERTFTFKNVNISADLILGGSNKEDSFIHKYNEIAKGNGSFKFINNNQVKITKIDIDVELDLFK